MAAPSTKTIKDLTGTWNLNKPLSDSTEPALTLQGISWLTRKAVAVASITLQVQQYTAPPLAFPADLNPPTSTDETKAVNVAHIDIEQTAAGLSSTHEQRCLDYKFRPHTDWLFGNVKGRSSYVTLTKAKELTGGEKSEEWLTKGWIEGEDVEEFMISQVESLDAGWSATQIWGFMELGGERRYVRNVMVMKGSEKVMIRMVYDFVQ